MSRYATLQVRRRRGAACADFMRVSAGLMLPRQMPSIEMSQPRQHYAADIEAFFSRCIITPGLSLLHASV